MLKGKRSFFERLTGAMREDEYETVAEEDTRLPSTRRRSQEDEETETAIPEQEEGQLTVDVFQTADDIVIRTIVAGVRPEDLDVSITRDMVTIKGSREEAREMAEEDYYHRELYWGSFSRTILLPQEIDIEGAEASEEHGLLTIKLPKLDKSRQTKLKVKSH